MHNTSRRIKAELALLAVSFIWGTTFVLVKEALSSIGPFTFLGLRFLAAFLFLALVTKSALSDFNRSTIKAGLIIGVFLLAGYLLQTLGLQFTTASKAGFITGLSVVIVPIIYSIYTLTWPSLASVVSVGLATAGLFLLTVEKGMYITSGDLLVLGCAFAFAMHIIMVDRYTRKYNPLVLTTIQIGFVAAVTLLLGLGLEPWPPVFSAPVVEALVITSIPATALAFLIQNAMQKYTTPTRTAIILITEPVFAYGFAHFWAGETLALRGLVGCLLIITGMLLSELKNLKLFDHS